MTTKSSQAADEEVQRFRDFLAGLPPDRLAWFARYADLAMQGDDIVTKQAQEKLFIGRISYGEFCRIIDQQHRLLLKNQAAAVAWMLNSHAQSGIGHNNEGGDG